MTMPSEPQTLTVRVPFAVRKRGGRKQVVTPDGSIPIFRRPQPNSALVKAVARAFRWRDMLESGAYGTIGDLAKAERINPSYLTRVLRLTLLAPDLIQAILDDHEPDLTLPRLLQPCSADWGEQRRVLKQGDDHD